VAKWYPLGPSGSRYPDAIRALRGKSGVYAIRTVGLLGGREVVYVGESHTGNLYGTLTRHFQAWRRGSSWASRNLWFGQFSPAQTDPGHTFDRARCEVSFQVVQGTGQRAAGRAITLQAKWIRKLKPTQNAPGVGVEEEVPF